MPIGWRFDNTYSKVPAPFISNILNKDISGIEALKILGKYSFFIGVAKLFDISDVRKSIEEALCIYTESEVLSDEETQETVDLVKDQLKNNKFPHERIKNCYYFQIGRWDIELFNNQKIKFPSNVTTEIIKQSAKLMNTNMGKQISRAKSHERAGLIDEAKLIYEQLFLHHHLKFSLEQLQYPKKHRVD